MDRAAQIQGYDKVNPKLRLEQLLKAVQHMVMLYQTWRAMSSSALRFATELFRDTLTFTRQKNAKDFRLFALNDYKKSYANTRKYNTKTKKYELFDTRTGTFFDRDNAFEYIESKNQEAAKAHYQKLYGTETPEKDIKYLQQNSIRKVFLNKEITKISKAIKMFLIELTYK